MPTKIEVNVQTGEQIVVELSLEELAELDARKKAWDAEQAAIQLQPTNSEIIASLVARITALESRA